MVSECGVNVVGVICPECFFVVCEFFAFGVFCAMNVLVRMGR